MFFTHTPGNFWIVCFCKSQMCGDSNVKPRLLSSRVRNRKSQRPVPGPESQRAAGPPRSPAPAPTAPALSADVLRGANQSTAHAARSTNQTHSPFGTHSLTHSLTHCHSLTHSLTRSLIMRGPVPMCQWSFPSLQNLRIYNSFSLISFFEFPNFQFPNFRFQRCGVKTDSRTHDRKRDAIQ